MAIEVSKNDKISGGKDGGRKGVGSAIRCGGANRGGGGEYIEKREQGGAVKRDVDPYIIRVKIR